jgi:hypothetical protein
MPERIQRMRVKGWKKPPNTINCTRPGQYGNPFKIGDPGIYDANKAVIAFEHWLNISPAGKVIASMAKKELKGKNLMCFCKLSDICHVDILLKIANE